MTPSEAAEGRRMTDTICRVCSECDGNHHFSESGLVVPEPDDEFIDGPPSHYVCKHCDAIAHVCDDCDGPIFPTGTTLCADCMPDQDSPLTRGHNEPVVSLRDD